MSGWGRGVVSNLRGAVGKRRATAGLRRAAAGLQMDASVSIRSPQRLTLGSDVVIDRGVVLHCGGMPWAPENSGIVIGSRTYIGPNAVLFGAGRIEIGDSVLIAPGVVITSHQHTFADREADIRVQPISFAAVVIDRDVWIGANATVLPGVRIGAGSIVAAGAVVTGSVPPSSVVMGIPARVVRER